MFKFISLDRPPFGRTMIGMGSASTVLKYSLRTILCLSGYLKTRVASAVVLVRVPAKLL